MPLNEEQIAELDRIKSAVVKPQTAESDIAAPAQGMTEEQKRQIAEIKTKQKRMMVENFYNEATSIRPYVNAWDIQRKEAAEGMANAWEGMQNVMNGEGIKEKGMGALQTLGGAFQYVLSPATALIEPAGEAVSETL